MTRRGFFAATRAQAEPCAKSLKLGESKLAPRHAGHYGADGDASKVIEIGEAVAIRMRSKIRQAARDEAVSLLKACIGGRITKAELAALLDASWKDVLNMLRGRAPFPAEAFVLVGVRRPDLAVEVVDTYVRFVVGNIADAARAGGYLDDIIGRLETFREERKAKKPS